jgi:hypothetical protein
MVGSVPVGGGAPISVQTMTNTLTPTCADRGAGAGAAEAGADIVRVSTPDEESTAALREIVREEPGADRRGHPLPLPSRHRGGRGRRRLPAHQPGQHRLARKGAGGRESRARPRLRIRIRA